MQGQSRTKNKNSKVQFKIQKNYPVLIWLCVLCYLLFGILISGRVLGGLYSLLKFLEMSFVGYYIAKFVDIRKDIAKIVLLLDIGVIAESAIAIAQFAAQRSIGGMLYFLGERTFSGSTPGIANASLSGQLVLRPYGTFSHPNVLAGYLLTVMTMTLFSLTDKKILKMRALGIFTLIVGTVSLFLSMSRIAILLWVLVLLYFVLKNIKLKKYTVIFLGLMAISLLSPISGRFTNISMTDEAITQRESLISASLQMIKSNPLLGVGLGKFLPTLSKAQKLRIAGSFIQPVHNIFLLIASETGLIGLGFFMWFLWKTYKTASSKWHIAYGLHLALFAILMTGMFDHYWLTLQQGQLLLAFVIGLSWVKPSETYIKV